MDKSLGKDLLRLGVAILIVGLAVSALQFEGIRAVISLDHPGEDPPVLAFCILSTLLVLAMVPRTWVCVVAGSFYGAVQGAFIAFGSALVAAVMMFFVSRWVLRGPIKRRMPEWMKPWYTRLNEDGFRWILLIRIAPIGHAAVANVLGGVSRMSFGSYFLATVVGFLPETIAYATLGSSFAKMSVGQLLLGMGMLLIMVISYRLFPVKVPVPDLSAGPTPLANEQSQ